MTGLTQIQIGEATTLLHDLAKLQKRYGRSDIASDFQALADWMNSTSADTNEKPSRLFKIPTSKKGTKDG